MEQKVCPRFYVKNQHDAGFQLNAVPVKTIHTVEGDTYYQLYFPRPWLLVGLVTLESPAVQPGFNYSYVQPMLPAVQNTFKEMHQAIFLDLAFATTHEIGYAVDYLEPGIQGRDYRGYFTTWLNNQSLATREQWYNSLIQPESIVQKFMSDNAASANDVWSDRHRNMVEFLKKTIQQNLMGAPGVYNIGQNTGGNPAWYAETSYELYQNA